jgi:hypothetical protein
MRRRAFLGLLSALAAGATTLAAARRAAAQSDRLTWWDPATPAPPPDLVVLEWRYLAGRITTDTEDFGFVVSMAEYTIPPLLPLPEPPPQLLVMRQDFAGDAGHVTSAYPSTSGYDVPSATYTYRATGGAAASAAWRLDEAAQRYELSVSSPQLSLSGLTLEPVGRLIPEAGTGQIVTGQFGGVTVRSDYHADWVAIRREGATIGYGRLDMQTLKPSGLPSATNFYHHWFAVAAEVAGEPVWISAWRLVSDVTSWVVTIARGGGASWRVESFTEATAGVAFPLAVTILDYQPQPVPAGAPARRTGRRWRLSAGLAAPGDLIDLEIAVPPGQFIAGARVAASFADLGPMQEAVTAEVTGTLGGAALAGARFAVAESTFSEPALRLHLPLLHT